jgi:malonyl-CoA O-methyltransferase
MSISVRDVARSFGAASATYDAAAALQTQVRAELLARLDLLKAPPLAVLDLGAGTGHAAKAIKQKFRRAAVTAVDVAAPMVAMARKQSRFWRRIKCVEADVRQLPFPDRSFDLVFSSLMLQWVDPLDDALTEVRRVLKPGGLFLASSFGPLTLLELRQAWASVDDAVHVNEFIDMHDFGGALQRAGFTEPVLDTDRHVRYHTTPIALMQELKAIGAHNLNPERPRGLTGKGALRKMMAAYETRRVEGGLPATWQVVYATAWAPVERDAMHGAVAAAQDGEVRIDLVRLKSRLRGRKK